jgi:hypothetical protein
MNRLLIVVVLLTSLLISLGCTPNPPRIDNIGDLKAMSDEQINEAIDQNLEFAQNNNGDFYASTKALNYVIIYQNELLLRTTNGENSYDWYSD